MGSATSARSPEPGRPVEHTSGTGEAIDEIGWAMLAFGVLLAFSVH